MNKWLIRELSGLPKLALSQTSVVPSPGRWEVREDSVVSHWDSETMERPLKWAMGLEEKLKQAHDESESD
jgi:hypothetical protein